MYTQMQESMNTDDTHTNQLIESHTRRVEKKLQIDIIYLICQQAQTNK